MELRAGSVALAYVPIPALLTQTVRTQYHNTCPDGIVRLDMACIHRDAPTNELNSLLEQDSSSTSDSDSDDDDALRAASSHDAGAGIDIDSIKSAKKVEHNVSHRVEAERSILALVVDDDYLFAGLEGGDITVSTVVLRSLL